LDITWAWAAYLAVTGVLTIWVGKIAGKKVAMEKLMVAGFAVNALFTFGYLLVSSPFHLLLVQIGLGVAVALSSSPWSALYTHASEKNRPSYVWGLANGGYFLATALAVLIGGFIVNYFSFTTLFVTMGIIQIIATLYQSRIFRHV
jgi:MFS family permease